MYKSYMKKIIKKLMKEVKENLSKRKGAPYSYIGRLNAVKMSVLPNY